MTREAMRGEDEAWASWLQQIVHDGGNAARGHLPPYTRIAERVLTQARIQAGDAVLDIGTGTGLLAFRAVEYVGETGMVIGCDVARACVEACRLEAERRCERRVRFIESDAAELPFNDNAFDAVVMRSTLCHLHRKRDVVRHLYRVLKPGGRLSLYEPVDRHNTRYYQLVDIAALGELGEKVKSAEERMYRNKRDTLRDFDETSLVTLFRKVGFREVACDLAGRSRQYSMTYALAREWWDKDIGGIPLPGRPSPREVFARVLTQKELRAYIDFFCTELDGKTITFESAQVYLWGSKGDGVHAGHRGPDVDAAVRSSAPRSCGKRSAGRR